MSVPAAAIKGLVKGAREGGGGGEGVPSSEVLECPLNVYVCDLHAMFDWRSGVMS